MKPPANKQPLCLWIPWILWMICAWTGIGMADDQTKARKPVKIAHSQYMPFFFEGAHEQPRGIVVDIWKQWSKETGIPVEFTVLPWEETVARTASGQIDVSALMYRTRDRENTYRFSTPLLHLSTYLYVAKNTPVQQLNDIAHLRVGGVAKDYTLDFLKQSLPHLVPVAFPDHESLVKAAVAGQIQAFIMEGPVASTYIAKHNGGNRLFRVETPLYTKPLHAGVRIDNHPLMEEINQGLSRIRPEETQAIVQAWTGAGQTLTVPPYSGKVKIAVSMDNMPFHFADKSGKAMGYFVDLWKLWSRKTGVEVEFITAPWAQSLELVKTGKADIHAGCFFSIQRDTFLDYAGVLSNCETHFFFHESIFGLKNLEDLKGFHIGLLDQDYAVEYVSRALPGAALKKYKNHRALFQGVAKGEVRVFICDTPTALYFLEEMDLLSKFRYHPTHPLYQKPFYSAVQEGNTALVQLINRGLEAITDKERAAIERKWMGDTGGGTRDVLVVAMARSFPPFSILSAEGRPTGLFVEMWKSWSEKTGKPVSFRMYDREAAIHALKNGIVDVVSFLPPNRATSGWAQKSTTFYRLEWYLYRHHNRIVSLSKNLPHEDRTLGVVSGSRAEEWLRANRPEVQIITFTTTRQMILSAVSGAIDAFIALPQEMTILPDQLGLPDAFTQSRNPLFQEQMGGIIRNFNSQLIRDIDQGFEAMEHIERIQMEHRWVKTQSARIFNPRTQQIHLTRRETKWLARHHDLNPPIRIGVNPQWPPFEFIGANQTYKGMVSDYVQLLNQRLGLNMTLVEALPASGPARGKKLAEFDVIPSALSFEPHPSKMKRTQPYLEFPWVVINKQDAPLIGGIRDLYGKTVAVVQRYAVRDFLKRHHPDLTLMSVRTTREALAAVRSGAAHACVENLALAGYQIQAGNFPGLKVAAETDLPGTGLVFSIRGDWPELVSILNKGIAGITEQEHDKIRQKWFSVRFEHQVDPSYVRELFIKIGIATLVLAIVFSFWNRQIRLRRQEAEAANLTKTKFLASLSHEIRNPLNAILGLTEMSLRSPLSLQNKKNLSAVKNSALHLLDVITDILDFATIEAGKMRIHPQVFHLPDLLANTEHTWKFLAREKGLWFNLVTPETLPATVESDPIRLQQVLSNLISNAVKFTHTGGVDVTVKPVHRAEDVVSLLFTVEDTGIGIDHDQQKKIFERFTQAEKSVTRSYGGAGLGLAICLETARLMGGTLKVKSTPGKGSRFDLKLPIQIAHVPGPVHGHSPMGGELPPLPQEQPPLTLLLAEDDKINAAVFKSFLADTRHVIRHAANGAEALEILRQSPVDMVFMDIEMPEMDGITATQAIRNGEAGAHNKEIPIVAMSAHVLAEIEKRARTAGINDFVAKPVDMDHLLQVIEAFRPREAAEPQAPDTPMDRDKALEALGGNPVLLARILDIFLQETPAQLEELRRDLASQRLDGVRRHAHTLKGAAARIFAQGCEHSARRLEMAARSRHREQINAAAGDTLEKFNQLLAHLKTLAPQEEESHETHS